MDRGVSILNAVAIDHAIESVGSGSRFLITTLAKRVHRGFTSQVNGTCPECEFDFLVARDQKGRRRIARVPDGSRSDSRTNNEGGRDKQVT
jgi:hypothetical protein